MGRASQLVLPDQQVLNSMARRGPGDFRLSLPRCSSTIFLQVRAATSLLRPAWRCLPMMAMLLSRPASQAAFFLCGKGNRVRAVARALGGYTPQRSALAYLVQQRMHFEPTIETPFGLTQAEIRILYMWPDGGVLTPALISGAPGARKMMGVDHNKNQEWVGGISCILY